VESVTVMIDKMADRSRGSAFVEINTEEALKTWMALKWKDEP